MSKLLKVPLSVIRDADDNEQFNYDRFYVNGESGRSFNSGEYLEDIDMPSLLNMSDLLQSEGEMQIVDHETDTVCQECLPIRGDDILGTVNTDGSFIIHRQGCNQVNKLIFGDVDESEGNVMKMDWNEESFNDSNDSDPTAFQYAVEVTIIANDRKLLLADCSEIVSEHSFILKTGSQTISKSNVEIVARLDFLVKVVDLNQLQLLMDKLSEVKDVMSVERRYGSTLL